MSVFIRGVTSQVDADVEATPKALKVIQYGVDGTLMGVGADGYFQAISPGISAAATPGAGSSIFHIRNAPAAAKNAWIRRIRLNAHTLAAATTPQVVDLELVRTSGADMSGGTAVSVANIGRKKTTQANPGISDFRYSTNMAALTTTSVVFGQQLATFLHMSIANNKTEWIWDFDDNEGPLVLLAGEGLALRNITAIGAAMTWLIKGSIQWDERA